MKKVDRLNPERDYETLSVAILDDMGIQQVNAVHLDRPKPTDVITFAYAPEFEHENWEGEVVVNIERALQEGPRHGGGVKEFALYLAHGCDHLSGADDATPAQRKRMRDRELRWLRQLEYTDLLA